MADNTAAHHTDNASIDITFFVPCLNEERNVTGALQVIIDAATNAGVSYEILVVDDCSTDGTVAIVKKFCEQHPDVPIILKINERNQGLGRNYAEGARIARGTYYMLINGDNVERREVVAELLTHLGTVDIIIPYFGRLDKRTLRRRFISRLFTRLVNLISGNSIQYYNGPVIHLRENVVRWHPGTRGFAYQAELITRLLAHGASFVQVEVPNEERKHGVSSAFRLKNIASVAYSLIKIGWRRFMGNSNDI